MDNQFRQEAQAIAGMLDRGDVRDASFRLNQDLIQLSQANPMATKEFLALTRADEQGGGADLVLHHIRDQYGQVLQDKLAIGIASPVRDNNGQTGWDVQDVGTVSVGPGFAQNQWRRPGQINAQLQPPDWQIQQNPVISGGWTTPRQQIWGENIPSFAPGGVPYNNAHTFNMPGSRYAYPITAAPGDYSTVAPPPYTYDNGQTGVTNGNPTGIDASYAAPAYDQSASVAPSYTDTSYADNNYASTAAPYTDSSLAYNYPTATYPPYNYGSNYNYNYNNGATLGTALALGAIGALSFGIGRRRWA